MTPGSVSEPCIARSVSTQAADWGSLLKGLQQSLATPFRQHMLQVRQQVGVFAAQVENPVCRADRVPGHRGREDRPRGLGVSHMMLQCCDQFLQAPFESLSSLLVCTRHFGTQ